MPTAKLNGVRMRSGRMARNISVGLALATAASIFGAAPAAHAFYLGDFTSTPAIAWTGSSVVITAVGTNGHLYYWWQAAGTSTWNAEAVGDEFSAPPQIAWVSDTAEIVSGAEDGEGFNRSAD
jgi:hypothetical protein